LFGPELAGEIPNVAGTRNGVDFAKGCFVGQEVVSRVENRGRPSRRLVGVRPGTVPDPGEELRVDGRTVGRVTRAVESPSLGHPVAMAYLEFGLETGTVTVGDDTAEVVTLPFVTGSERSGRLPAYEE
jgi:aminomethyltransferase